MTDFLLELLSEEIPARMQARAREDLARLFAAEIAKTGLAAAALETYATPRRLALIARGLPEATQALAEELKGPRASAPPQALEGFLRKTGLTREQLVERDGVLFARIEKPGRATAQVLAEAISAIVRAFPWPKSMRWGAASASTASLRWVRPLKGIVALLGDEVVACEVDGIASGAATRGHRFHHPGVITIGNADDYAAKLRACHVILDPDERARVIREGAASVAAAEGLEVVADEGLVAENAGLTEWPVPLLGRFDPAFLQVPREVIQLTMRTNQKYFASVDATGALAPAFVCTANIAALDGGAAIVAGNAKVLAARLADARFFWEQDLKVPLEAQAAKLADIVFHEKLGTVADKVERVAKLARWLVEEGIVRSSPRSGEGDHAQHGGGAARLGGSPGAEPPPPSLRDGPPPRAGEDRARLADLAERAARLCKADLVTGMVGEFPELQGVMGGYYARAQGEPDAVADAIRDHYKPVGQGDEVPTAPVTVAVSLADKLDTLALFFLAEEVPTGSRDPYALRRSTLSVIRLIVTLGLRLEIGNVIQLALAQFIGRRMGNIRSGKMNDLVSTLRQAGVEVNKIGIEKLRDILTRQALGKDEMNVLFIEPTQRTINLLLDFFADRLKVQQREAGVRHDLIDAVFALGGEDDLVRLLARVHALQAFVATEDGANLLAGYKRAANILKKEGYSPSPRLRGEGRGEGESGRDALDSPSPSPPAAALPLPAGGERVREALSYSPEPAEAALIAALDSAEPAAERAVRAEDFAGAMRALAGLRAPIDAFFEAVTVNDPDPARRAARLALLARVREAVHRVADFSRIEG